MRTKTFWLLVLTVGAGALTVSCSSTPSAAAVATETAQPVAPATAAVLGCSAIDAAPTPNASSLLPPITSADFSRGPISAPVTLLYYCDFQSYQCEQFNEVLDQLVKEHPSDLRVVMRPFPVPASVVPTVPPSQASNLNKSEISAAAALAAANQDKFWEMRDLLQSQHASWKNLPPAGFQNWVIGKATTLGMDGKRFRADLTSSATQARTRSLYDSAGSLGITSIPTVFINGGLVSAAGLRYQDLGSTISLIALGPREFKACPPFSIDRSRSFSATLHLSRGDVTIQLFAAKAPLAVNSFVFLARQGWFDGVTFHRVIPGFVAQAGDPSGTGMGGPGYFFDNEVSLDLLFDKPGMVGMANSGPNTNGSQFFITYAAEPQLDGRFTVFGQVVSGMPVIEGLTPRDPTQDPTLPPGDKILNVTIQEQ